MFQRDLVTVQNLLKRIPKGKITTYKDLAKAIGKPRSARYVGYLLKNNPEPDKYSCYKVVKSDGKIGGYSGMGGVKGKIRRLQKDGVKIEAGRIKDFRERLFNFKFQISN